MRVVIVERGTMRIGQRDAHVGVQLFQPHADACNRAACPGSAGEAVDLTAGLLPQLLGRAFDVCAAVGGIVELPRPDRALGFIRHAA